MPIKNSKDYLYYLYYYIILHMFDAIKLRKLQVKKELKEWNNIINFHYEKLKKTIDYYKINEKCFFEISSYIPTYPSYNPSKVADDLCNKMNQSNEYKCQKVSDNTLFIQWKNNTNDNELKQYIMALIDVIYKKIKDSTNNFKYNVSFVVPNDIRFKKKKVAKCIREILVRKNFKVSGNTNIMFISW